MNNATKHSRSAAPTSGDTTMWVLGILFVLMAIVGTLVTLFARTVQDSMAGTFAAGVGLMGCLAFAGVALYRNRSKDNQPKD